MIRELQIGDLVQVWFGMAIILERDTQTETGEHWWKVWNVAKNRTRIVGEWEFSRIS